MRALFLAFEFPPLANGGVFRALRLAESLGEEGIQLDVVTLHESDAAKWNAGGGFVRLDDQLLDRIPPTVRVHRIASGFPSWYWRALRGPFAFRLTQYTHWGDPVSRFWRRPLFACLDELVRERRPDVLLTTAPPFGVAVLGHEAARRYRLPWVADWRDPWTMWSAAPFPSYAHYRYARSREGAALRAANVSVATSPVTREDWLRTFPGADPARLVTVYNSYDPHPPVTPDPSKTRRIAYVGSFYYNPRSRETMMRPAWRRAPQQWLFYSPRREDWRYRSPYYFLVGLRRFADRCPQLIGSLRVEFAGTIPNWLPPMLRETGTESLVTLLGPVPHAKSLRLQANADAMLLTSAKVIGGRDYSIASKTFEYLARRRPVLAVLTDGAMRDVIAASGLGIFADPDSPDTVADAIARIVTTADPSTLVSPDEAYIAQFDRRIMARAMAGYLRQAAAEGFRG